MYKEGRAVVKEVVEDVQGVIEDAKGIQEDAISIFSFFSSIFGFKPKINEKNAKVVQKVAPKAAKKKKQKQPEFDENAIYSQVGSSLMQFFKARTALRHYIEEEEEKAKHILDNLDDINDIAVKLTIANLQMEKMNEELREYMIYHVPPEMKDLYSRTNAMIGEVENQQAVARQAELVRRRTEEWRRKQMQDRIRDQSLTILVTLVIIAWMWTMILTLTHSPQF
jgi:hypothetical protein